MVVALLTSLPFMQVSPVMPRQTVGRTFIVSISLMGVLLVVQIGAAFYALYQRGETAPAPVAAAPLEAVAPQQPAPVAEVPKQEVLPGLAPTPMPRVRNVVSVETRIAALVEQSRSFRQRGDTNSALIKLREAQTLEGDHSLVIAEMALTYEMMSLTDKALEQWQRLSALGESAGALSHLARMKLDPAFAARDVSAVEAGGMPVDLADLQGIQPGATLGLMEIQVIESQDPEVAKKLDLKIGLRARPEAEIDVRDVMIQVLFFDIIEDEHVVRTNATVDSRWITAPADWRDDGVEILEVGYVQPKVPAEELTPEEATRKYYGYIVRVHYKDLLEDVRADPVSLLSQFPSTPDSETN